MLSKHAEQNGSDNLHIFHRQQTIIVAQLFDDCENLQGRWLFVQTFFSNVDGGDDAIGDVPRQPEKRLSFVSLFIA